MSKDRKPEYIILEVELGPAESGAVVELGRAWGTTPEETLRRLAAAAAVYLALGGQVTFPWRDEGEDAGFEQVGS